jgi:RNA polymerase sigma-70 factor, ECF subfamily
MESMLKIWEQRIHEDTQINLAPYVFSALRNKALNFLRDEKTRLRVHSYLAEHQEKELSLRISTLQACDPELIFSKDMEKIIRKAMNAIPEKSRKIFELTRQGIYTQPEIADKLGVSVKTIEFHVSKALRVLKLHLQNHIPFYWIIVLFR